MAHEMDDLEFLLPSELLTDDDLITDFGGGLESSDLSSPVESVTGTAETGIDEDDFVSELTRKLTHSALRGSSLSGKFPKLSGSPQSTLSGFSSASRLTPNADSRFFSPPDAKDALSWDMLYAAAEEVARIHMVEEAAAFYASDFFGPAHTPNPGSVVFSNRAQTHHSYLSYQQFQAAECQQMSHHQLVMKNRVMRQGNMEYFLQNGIRDAGVDRAYDYSFSGWPTAQQSQEITRLGLNSVLFGETAPVKERVGTGVFMPRRFGSNQPETRKKSDVVLKPKNDVLGVQNQGRNRMAISLMKQECRLPQEWTY